MVETIKTATAVDRGRERKGSDHGTHPRENKHRKSTGATKKCATVTSSMFYKGQDIRDSQVRAK